VNCLGKKTTGVLLMRPIRPTHISRAGFVDTFTLYLVLYGVVAGCLPAPAASAGNSIDSWTSGFRVAYVGATGAAPRTLAAADNVVDDVGPFIHFDIPGLSDSAAQYWVRFRPQQFNQHVSIAPGDSGLAEMSADQKKFCLSRIPEVNSPAVAWDAAYQMIGMHENCPNAHLLSGDASSSGRTLQIIEPRIPDRGDWRERLAKAPSGTLSSRAWPIPECDSNSDVNESKVRFWERGLECDYSQFSGLDAALDVMRQRVPTVNSPDGQRVLIAHLDTGYPGVVKDVYPEGFPDYPYPFHLDTHLSADCYEYLVGNPNASYACMAGHMVEKVPAPNAWWGIDVSKLDPPLEVTSWFITNPLHGANTLSILAGGFVPAAGEASPPCVGSSVLHYGANPCAAVIEVRIGQSFAHANEESMAAGIGYAIGAGADLISLSHGGFPAAILASAVESAYTHGVPIFAASGDYLGTILGSTPKTVVFPARYDVVINVTGVTATGESAGRACNILKCIWHFSHGNGMFSNLESWFSRTNFAEPEVMAGHTIAAYTPNVSVYDTQKLTTANDEPGTSASVPQVAAAASMWLEANRTIMEQGGSSPSDLAALPGGSDIWRSWRKSEGVYQALLKSANAKKPSARWSDDDWTKYRLQYLGAGVLNARRLLDSDMNYQPLDDCYKRRYPEMDLAWWPDFFGSMAVAEVLHIPISQLGQHLIDLGDTSFALSTQAEMSQVAFRSEKLTRLLKQITKDARGTVPEYCNPTAWNIDAVPADRWYSLIAFVQSDSKASRTLKLAVAAAVARHEKHPPRL
jgi:Subtilase family